MSTPHGFNQLPAAATTARDALDQLDELRAAMSAVADLAAPGNDLHCVDRNNLSMLLSLLLRLQAQATQSAWDGLQAMRERETEGTKLADIAELIVARHRAKSAAPEGNGGDA